MSIQDLPNEILGSIIQCMLDSLTINERSGCPDAYYTPGRRVNERRTTATLAKLCLTCRRFRGLATPLFYRHVILQPSLIKPPTTGELFLSKVRTLALFLRTLVERPDLRQYIVSVDCRFLLGHYSYRTLPEGPEPPEHHLPGLERLQHFQQVTEKISDLDYHVWSYTGLEPGYSDTDMLERAFVAILCFLPELQSLALPVPPAERYHLNHMPDHQYHVMDRLLKSTHLIPSLSNKLLEKVTSVRFTVVAEALPSQNYGEFVPDDPTLRPTPEYTFEARAFTSIMECLPNLQEFETDSMDYVHIDSDGGPLNRVMNEKNIKRAYLTAAHSESVFNSTDERWNLDTFVVRHAENTASWPPYPEFQDPQVNAASCDESLLKLSKSLRVVDIGYLIGKEDPDSFPTHLTCLPSLLALEHLCIGMNLLNTVDGFSSRPLSGILPPGLRTLTLRDWVAGNYYDDYGPGMEFMDKEEDDVEEGLHLLVQWQKGISTMLRTFARACGKSHPRLRSVMVFGFRPLDRKLFYSDCTDAEFYRLAREAEMNGPEPGQVVRQGLAIRSLFSQAGVEFEEYFHAQEVHFPFREVQVERYA